MSGIQGQQDYNNRMHNHAPKNYRCPFCQLASGIDLDQDHSVQSDIVYKDKAVIAFIATIEPSYAKLTLSNE
jgi:hypothetical protein